MLPQFLIPEAEIHESGTSEMLELGENPGPVLFTLGILETVEQESLLMAIHGSQDGTEWSASPLIEFPQKFYSGVSSILFDPASHIAVRYLRAQWKTNRWGRGSKTPAFRLYLFAEFVAERTGRPGVS